MAERRPGPPKSPGRPPGPGGSSPGPGGPRPYAWWIWILVGLIIANFAFALIPHGELRAAIPYTTFRQQVAAGNVGAIETSGNSVTGTFVHPITWTPHGGAGGPAATAAAGGSRAKGAPPGTRQPASPSSKTPRPAGPPSGTPPSKSAPAATYRLFSTVLPPFQDATLWPLLLAHHVTVTSAAPGASWASGLLLWIPLLALGALFFFASRRMQQGASGLFGFGKSRARLYQRDQPKVTFDDVAGEEEAKEALRDVVNFLRDPRPFRAVGARIPRGVLLVGPPGTGKTLLARAVAGEAGCTFLSAAATEFVEMFVGVGAARVRDLFSKAKASPPAIVFLDEIDAVGRRRGAAIGPGNEEREQTLNQLLGEMDGFTPNVGVVVLAATNRGDVLDPALLRPGRFDRQVTVGLPDRPGREAILKIHARNTPLASDVDLAVVARSTAGFSGADLANLVNEAAIQAGHRKSTHVSMEDFENAEDRIVMGGLTGMKMSDDERRSVAYHEAGHALAAMLSPDADPVRRVSIVPRGRALGVTLQVPLDDRHNYSRQYLFTRLVILLGGRAAEDLVFHERTTGAEDDLRHAVGLAHQMVARWGMSDALGLLAPEAGQSQAVLPFGTARPYSEATAARIDEETARTIAEAYARVTDLLRARRDALDRIAGALMHEEVLDPQELAGLLEGDGVPSLVRSEADREAGSQGISAGGGRDECGTG